MKKKILVGGLIGLLLVMAVYAIHSGGILKLNQQGSMTISGSCTNPITDRISSYSPAKLEWRVWNPVPNGIGSRTLVLSGTDYIPTTLPAKCTTTKCTFSKTVTFTPNVKGSWVLDAKVTTKKGRVCFRNSVTNYVVNCGDGISDEGEQCDDGNLISGDGCSSICHTEFCGNNIVDVGEECDFGSDPSVNAAHYPGCELNCIWNVCGDGDKSYWETCDDGNTINGDGCSSVCYLE